MIGTHRPVPARATLTQLSLLSLGERGSSEGRQRTAFTLIELLLVLAILGALIGLLLPGIAKVRESASRTACRNNLRQFGLAVYGYQDDHHGRFPPGGRYNPVDDSNNGDKGSWLVYLLPYMEEGEVFNQIPDLCVPGRNSIGRATASGIIPFRLANGRCPSDGAFPTSKGVCNYAASMGPQCVPGRCPRDFAPGPYQRYCDQQQDRLGYGPSAFFGDSLDPAQIRGVFGRWGCKIDRDSVTDGLSNTIMIGELLPAQRDFAAAYQNWALANGGYTCTTIIPINHMVDVNLLDCSDPERRFDNWSVAWGFKSNHPAGANFVFADGSVHFLIEEIDMDVYQLLGCRNDQHTIPDY